MQSLGFSSVSDSLQLVLFPAYSLDNACGREKEYINIMSKKMKNLKVALMALLAASMFTACSDDDDNDPTVYRRVITFENSGCVLAGPTSYGANLYANYSGTKFVSGSVEVEKGVSLDFGVNYSEYNEEYDFSAGGMVLSQWNYRSNPEGQSGADWWYSYQNQCSVYNTNSVDGKNEGAGADGSNTFAVINGYDDEAWSMFKGAPEFSFSAGAEYTVESIQICPPSYLYGIITKGNPYGNDPGLTLAQSFGWFKILAYGFDAQGNPTNGGQPVEKYICDYRQQTNPTIEISSVWQGWDLSALGRVNKVRFDFDGSDKGAYGLNTPAYMCLDNIQLRLN